MADYISREAVETFLRSRNYCIDTDADIEYVVECLRKEIPAANVRPVVMAHWIETASINEETMKPLIVKGPHLKCSNCGSIEFQRNFCPNCGADLRT